MLRRIVLGIGMIGLAIVAAGCAKRGINLLQIHAGPQPVIIQVRCPSATNVITRVLPERVTVRPKSDSVLWVIVGHATRAEIDPKTPGRWPFANPPHVVTPGQPVNSGDVLDNARPGSYAYKVTAECQVPGGGPVITVTIDPDVIITEE